MAISLADCRVLIVDDNEFNRKSLGLVIRRAGITEIAFAVDGEEGLQAVDRFRPDLVLLDVDMPGIDGLEMCRRLRASPVHGDLPVLFQTVLDSEDEQVRCFEAGGSDFITKPIKSGECIARVRHQLERRKLFTALAAFRERIEGELSQARAMQISLLPEPRRVAEIGTRHNLAIHAHFEASSELSGDFWTLFDLDPSRVGFMLVDFAGHGITAALNTFRLHTLINRFPPVGIAPADWLMQLNGVLKDVLPVGQFATVLYGVLDATTDTFTYAAAACPHPVLGVEGDTSLLESAGLVLGVSRKARYVNRTVSLPPGGFVFLYSDALIESRNNDGLAIGRDGIAAEVRAAHDSNPAEPLRPLLARFRHNMPATLRDDLTAVWIERLK
jgi:sigma-B regulation protein RsbU (phosphoserine phosphatase)